MKQLLAASVIVAFLAGVSCERHEWKETKVLHEGHGGDHGHGSDHGSGAQGEQGAEDDTGH